MKEPKNILLINCDWRDIFRSDFDELYKKLQRDRLNPEYNHFYIFSWAHTGYHAQSESNKNFKTLHQKTYLSFFKPWFDLISILFVPLYVRDQNIKPDAVVVYDFGFVPAALLVKAKTGAKIIMCINNMPRLYSAVRKFGEIKSVYSWILEFIFHRFIDTYMTINVAMEDYLLAIGVKQEKIHIFSMDTINRDREYIQTIEKGSIRKKYNITPEDKILICVARLEAEKNYVKLLELFSKLDTTHHLFILGEGSLRKELENKATTLGIVDRVVFLGFVNRKDIWNYYADADVFVLLSKVEALGVVVWEAMYMKVPVLGSTAHGILESVGVNEERGFLLNDEKNIEEFIEKINKCVTASQNKEESVFLKDAKAYVEEKITNNLSINDLL